MKRLHSVVLITTALMMPLVARGQAEDSCEARLRSGQRVYREKQARAAAQELRIACFGFLVGECAEALADFKAFPPAALDARPDVHADRLLCCVAGEDWTGAETTLRPAPARLVARSGVVAAQEQLTVERQRRSRERTCADPAREPFPRVLAT